MLVYTFNFKRWFPPLHPHRDSYLTVEIRVGDNDDDDDDLRFVEEDNFGKVNKFHDLGDNSFLEARWIGGKRI